MSILRQTNAADHTPAATCLLPLPLLQTTGAAWDCVPDGGRVPGRAAVTRAGRWRCGDTQQTTPTTKGLRHAACLLRMENARSPRCDYPIYLYRPPLASFYWRAHANLRYKVARPLPHTSSRPA